MKQTSKAQHTDKNLTISYAGYRFPPALISYAVWLYFRFPLSLRMVEEMLAARGIEVTYETVRRWALKFGQQAAVKRSKVETFVLVKLFLLLPHHGAIEENPFKTMT
jgi:transposase-like protein